MNRKKRKSSRLRHLNRRRSRPGQVATVPVLNSRGDVVAGQLMNRQYRRETKSWINHAKGRSLKEAARDKRRKLQIKARRAVRIMRRELKQALRRGWV